MPGGRRGNRRDAGTHGIIGEMCRCEKPTVDENVWGAPDAARRTTSPFGSRDSIHQSLVRMWPDVAVRLCRIPGPAESTYLSVAPNLLPLRASPDKVCAWGAARAQVLVPMRH